MAYVDVTDATFETEVIQKSHEVPVLVDFWAAWCGPCRMLGPVIEKLADEACGDWVLAKLDTDANQATAARYGIRGIPNVKAFVNGEVIDEFSGALPESTLRKWLEKALPEPSSPALDDAAKAIRMGQFDQARTLLEGALSSKPDDVGARLLLAHVDFHDGNIAAAEKGLEAAADAENDYPADYQKLWFKLAAQKVRPEAELDKALNDSPNKVDLNYEVALRRAANEEWDSALGHLLKVVSIDRSYNDDAGRKEMIRIYHILGEDDPRTAHWRNEMGRAMY